MVIPHVTDTVVREENPKRIKEKKERKELDDINF